MPLQEVLRRARELTREIDDEAKRSTLPQKPDFEVADAFLTDCRREAARRSLAVGVTPSATREHEGYRPAILPVPLPPDVRTDALERFVARYVSPESSERSPLLWLALSGAHACGFPSPDSDLDLKGVPNGVRAHDPRSERAREVVKAPDTTVLVRFLVKDDKAKSLRAKTLFESAEKSGERFSSRLLGCSS